MYCTSVSQLKCLWYTNLALACLSYIQLEGHQGHQGRRRCSRLSEEMLSSINAKDGTGNSGASEGSSVNDISSTGTNAYLVDRWCSLGTSEEFGVTYSIV
jgi:hypothetical protein